MLQNIELSRAYADLDILAFPSETDTFGLVVLEALASGVPAVVTGRGGPKSVVQHARTGYVAENFGEFIIYIETLSDTARLAGWNARGGPPASSDNFMGSDLPEHV